MPNTSRDKPLACNHLHAYHVLQDNVPGNSYVVKASGFPTPRHPDDLGVLPGLTPETEQHQISLTERKVLRAGAPVIKNVIVEQRIKLMERNVQVSSGFGFSEEFIGWFECSSHSFLVRIPNWNAGEQECCTVNPAT
jgi:hypothetical protein